MQKEAIRQLNEKVAELEKQDEHFKQKEAELAKKDRVSIVEIRREGKERKEGMDRQREGEREGAREGGREGTKY